jgi:AcrR family transcriptional regulator
MREPSDTRTRIQAVALELFIEQGYEATSLREIAERLGVTKAALYYHFKTKEDIVASLVQDRIDALEELLDWAEAQPPGPRLREEIIRRYSDELHRGRHHDTMRFFERNQTALRDHPKNTEFKDIMLRILNVLSAPDDPLAKQLKSSLAIFALHATWFVLRDPDVTDAQRQDAALAVALELVGAQASAEATPAAG